MSVREAITESMLKGYFEVHSIEPQESELNACIEYFERMYEARDNVAMNLLVMVIEGQVLISGFDTNKNEPKFAANNIRIQ